MARPIKKGLDYFPLDTDIFENDKLFDVQNDYGPLGEVIYIRLLCLVYRNGYYYQFESLDKLAAMMIRSIGNRWAKDKKTVKEVILYLAKINLFSSELMRRNVITSRSIQERYQLAVERRQSKIEEYNLLEKNNFHEGLLSAPKNAESAAKSLVSVTETPDNVSDNATKESKEKKSKVKESKGEETAAPSAPPTRCGRNQCASLTEESYRQLVYDYGEKNVETYLERADEWAFNKNKKLFSCHAIIRKWLEQDNVPKTDHSVDKYKCVINQFQKE